jgi:hypothetical protein
MYGWKIMNTSRTSRSQKPLSRERVLRAAIDPDGLDLILDGLERLRGAA